MRRNAVLVTILMILATISLTSCQFALSIPSTAGEPYPYNLLTPRTTPAFKAPAVVPSANVDPNLRVPILMYHEVAQHTRGMDTRKLSLFVTPKQFALQMQYLKSHGFTTVTLDDWMAARAGTETLPRNPVILTFDDGRLSVYQNAFPVLKRNGQKAILFLISAEVGRVVKGYVNWSMVREMQSTGLIMFGSHTVHHVALPSLTLQRTLTELSYSKIMIERNTGRRCDYFCYPYGRYNASVAMLVGIAGYRAAASEIPGPSRVTDNAYELRRIRVDGRDSMTVFRSKLASRAP